MWSMRNPWIDIAALAGSGPMVCSVEGDGAPAGGGTPAGGGGAVVPLPDPGGTQTPAAGGSPQIPPGNASPPIAAGHGSPQVPAGNGDPTKPVAQGDPDWLPGRLEKAKHAAKTEARDALYRELGISTGDATAAKEAFGEVVKSLREHESELDRLRREGETQTFNSKKLQEQISKKDLEIQNLTDEKFTRNRFDAIDAALASVASGKDKEPGLIPHESGRPELRRALERMVGNDKDGTAVAVDEKGKRVPGQTVEEFVQAWTKENEYFFQPKKTADGGGSQGGDGEGSPASADFDPRKATRDEKRAELRRRLTPGT